MSNKLKAWLLAALLLTLVGLIMAGDKKNPSDSSMVDMTAGVMRELKENTSKTQVKEQTAQRVMNVAGGFVEWTLNFSDIRDLGSVATTRQGRGFGIIFDESGSTPGLSVNISFDNDNAPLRDFRVGDKYVGQFDRIVITNPLAPGPLVTPPSAQPPNGLWPEIRGQVKFLIITEPLSDKKIVKAKDRNGLIIQDIRQGFASWVTENADSKFQQSDGLNQRPTYADLTEENGGVGLDINGARGYRFTFQKEDLSTFEEPMVVLLYWLPPNSVQWFQVAAPYQTNLTDGAPINQAPPLAATTLATGQHALGSHPMDLNGNNNLNEANDFMATPDIPVHCAAGRIFPVLLNLSGGNSVDVFITGYAWK